MGTRKLDDIIATNFSTLHSKFNSIDNLRKYAEIFFRKAG